MSELMHPTLDDVIRELRRHHGDADADLVRRAHAIAERAHAGQHRLSGDPYLTHPVAVAMLLAEWGEPADMVGMGLLHDVPTQGFLRAELLGCLGHRGAAVLMALEDLEQVPPRLAQQLADRFSDDPPAMEQAIILKFADRMHNARTWDHVPPARAAEKARQTSELFVPLAKERGLDLVAAELEELSARVLSLPATVAAVTQTSDLAGVAVDAADAAESAGVLRVFGWAVGMLPEGQRERYAGEWLAELGVLTGRRERWIFVLGLLYSARGLRRDAAAYRTVFPRPQR